MEEMQLNDIGTAIIVTVKDQDAVVINMASATTKNIVLRKPDGTTVTKTASFTTDGSDGKIQYVTTSGDINKTGVWEVQAQVAVGTFDGKTSINNFRVLRNI